MEGEGTFSPSVAKGIEDEFSGIFRGIKKELKGTLLVEGTH
jgi:hypothetical protein